MLVSGLSSTTSQYLNSLAHTSSNFSNISGVKYFVGSLLIVFGGTISSTFISHPLNDAKRFLGIIGKSWKANPVQLVETLTLIVDVSKIARKNILAIEDALPSIENLFLRGGLRLVVDRADREAIVEMMAHEVKYTMAGKDNEIAVVGTMASLCPAWGMLGTLVGLVLLLQNLDDPSMIGPAMAIALITTFYGSLFANVIFAPAKKRMFYSYGSNNAYEVVSENKVKLECSKNFNKKF